VARNIGEKLELTEQSHILAARAGMLPLLPARALIAGLWRRDIVLMDSDEYHKNLSWAAW
jgi:hypothetical protein